MELFLNNFFALPGTGLVLGSVYALIALGYTMVYGVLQLINFAHSEVFMYGTFAVIWTFYFMGGAPASRAAPPSRPRLLQLINFAHSEVFMYGTFAVIWTFYFMGGSPASSTGAVFG